MVVALNDSCPSSYQQRKMSFGMKEYPIELRPAYVWDCPECGRECFERTVVIELSEEEMQQYRSEMGIQPWDQGNFQGMPSEVTCPHCSYSSKTVHFCDDEEELQDH